jgi:UDP:flavonoid glycosyltransferase YjiC (YdhE family)
VDQQRVLSRAGVFVTRGGSNRLREAVLAQVPPVVAPLFRDQMLIGRAAQRILADDRYQRRYAGIPLESTLPGRAG